MKRKQILLVDGNGMVHRDHAANGKPGEFAVRRMKRLAERLKCDQIRCCWDTTEPTFRHELVPSYKAGRKRKAGIEEAIKETQEALAPLGIEHYDAPGFEADDVIATQCEAAVSHDWTATIYSTDQDFFQLLIRGWVRQLTRFKLPDVEWMTEDGLMEKFGMNPIQWVDYRVMVGDRSDALPGFVGLGPVNARKVLADGRLLEAYYENPEAVKLDAKKRAAMTDNRGKIKLFRQLVRLRTDIELRQIV